MTDAYLMNVIPKFVMVFWGINSGAYVFKLASEKLIKDLNQKKEILSIKNARMKSIFDFVHHGIFTINNELKVDGEYSVYIEKIFETKNIEGKSFIDLLFVNSNLGTDKIDQIKSVVSSSMGESSFTFELNEHILPLNLSVKIKENQKNLEISWNTIVDKNEDIIKILVTIKDVTDLKMVQSQNEIKNRSIQILTQLLELDQGKLKGFFDWCEINLNKGLKILENDCDLSLNDVKFIFRTLHTLKGTARMFSFEFIVDLVHKVEQKYADMLKNTIHKYSDKQDLLRDLLSVIKSVNEYRDSYQKKLHVVAGSNRSEIQSYKKVSEIILSMKDYIEDESKLKENYTQVYNIVHQNCFDTFENLTRQVVNSLFSIASGLGKQGVNVNFSCNDVLFSKTEFKFLEDVLLHCFRNSIDHGIESPEIRREKGKNEVGAIKIDVKIINECGIIEIEDDGSGLNLEALKKKGYEKKLISENSNMQQIADIIFCSGISTAERVTDISGRGVGMDAVKNFLMEKGGDLKIKLKGTPNNEGKVPFSLVIYLPERYFLDTSNYLPKAS